MGYKFEGPTLETAFEKAMTKINSHMELTVKYVGELQKLIKNEKISMTQKMRIEGEIRGENLRKEDYIEWYRSIDESDIGRAC